MHFFIDLITEYGLSAMFTIILLEYACFPISSEIILPFSGAVASMNRISFLVILPLSVLAGLIGTGICYAFGWFGGNASLHAIKKRFPKAEKGIDSAYDKFNRYGSPAVCLGRVIPLIRTYIAFIAGSARLHPITYFGASAIGITVWNTLLLGLGYTLRENYKQVGIYYARYKQNLIPVFLLFATAVLLSFMIRTYQKNKNRKSYGS
jgi:membrane protein DedA with SNARE-associated domain